MIIQIEISYFVEVKYIFRLARERIRPRLEDLMCKCCYHPMLNKTNLFFQKNKNVLQNISASLQIAGYPVYIAHFSVVNIKMLIQILALGKSLDKKLQHKKNRKALTENPDQFCSFLLIFLEQSSIAIISVYSFKSNSTKKNKNKNA